MGDMEGGSFKSAVVFVVLLAVAFALMFLLGPILRAQP